MKLGDLPTPAFVINRSAFQKNCSKILKTVKHKNLKLRPHVKTHKTVEGCLLQIGDCPALVTGFVCSTIPEVAMLVGASKKNQGPFLDILYGVPISQSKLQSIERLRHSGCTVRVMIDHPHQVSVINEFLATLEAPTPLTAFLKLDTGYHRAGITCDHRGVELVKLIEESPYILLHGLYSHCGHSYNENETAGLDAIATNDLNRISHFLGLLKHAEIETRHLVVSVGSTASAFHHHNHLDLPHMEIHAGNYTLYDRQQVWTGECTLDDVAGRVISRVIGHYEDRNTILLDAGATSLTKDLSPQGGMCEIGGAPDLDCFRMSQEVITVTHATRKLFPFESFPLGTVVNLIPNHSCLAAACFDKYYIIDDPSCTFDVDQDIVDEWIPTKFFHLDC